jgi:hypothetical protein
MWYGGKLALETVAPGSIGAGGNVGTGEQDAIAIAETNATPTGTIALALGAAAAGWLRGGAERMASSLMSFVPSIGMFSEVGVRGRPFS